MAQEGQGSRRYDEIRRHLTDLGLEELEAEIYLALLRNGPSKAGSVIGLTDASRGTVYRVLKDLVDRGIVEKELSQPARYRAVDPEQLFDASLESVARQMRYIEVLRDRLEDPLEELANTGEEPTEPEWAIIEGRSSIYDRISERGAAADDTIETLSTQELHLERLPIVEEAWSCLLDRADQGLTVRILSHRPDDLRSWLEELGPVEKATVEGLEASDLLHFVLFDRDEVIYWLDASDVPGVHDDDDVAMHTDAPGLVEGALTLFNDHWPKTDPARA